jgi:hypothetical protein
MEQNDGGKHYVIFKPQKKLYITLDEYFSLAFLGSILLLFIDAYIGKYRNFCALLTIALQIIIFLGGIYLRLTVKKRFELLKGKLEGDLCIAKEYIRINDASYPIESFNKISLLVGDYYGKRLFASRGIHGDLSQGVNNRLILHFSDRKDITCYFRIESDKDLKILQDSCIHYYVAGKLHLLHLIDAMGIIDYDKIQEFKRTLPPVIKK